MDIKLRFGLRDGNLIEISDVESGLACNCTCPGCGQRLVARKGEIKEHHFAHYNSEECKGSVESAMHRLAKLVLEKEMRIVLPAVYLRNTSKLLYQEREIVFERVELEKRIDPIIPDVVVYINGRPLIIEIAVSHFSDRFKRKKIRELGISAIEIDVKRLINTAYDKDFPFDSFEELLIEETRNKYWLNNLKHNAFHAELIKLAIPKTAVHLDLEALSVVVHDCPLEKRIWRSGYKQERSYATADDDCEKCIYGTVVKDKNYFNGRNMQNYGKITAVRCAGHHHKDIVGLIAQFTNPSK